MGKAQLKTVTPEAIPTLTSQIAVLVDRKQKIKDGSNQIKFSMQTYQQRLDDAEEAMVAAMVDHGENDTPQSREAFSDSRVARNTITTQHESQKHEFTQLLPKVLDTLQAKINTLTGQKKTLELEVIADQLDDIEPLKAKAREAISELAAAWCMETTRNPNYTGVKLVVAKLDADKSVTSAFHHKFNELEAKMGFDSI
jgi:hypothetical protein